MNSTEIPRESRFKARHNEKRLIEEIPLFPELCEEEITFLADRGVKMSFPKNTLLMCEGDDSDFMYILLKGRVKVFVSNDDGKEVVLNIQESLGYFGELSMIDNDPRSASVISVEAVHLSYISKMEFEKCLAERPELAVRFLRVLTQRVRYLTNSVKTLALKDVYGRLVYTLERLINTGDGVIEYPYKLSITHQNLANMVGASRVMVSRIMKDLTEGGYIKQGNRHITILRKLPVHW